MSVREELDRFRGMKGAMAKVETRRERSLFPTIGIRVKAVPRTEVLPAGRRRAPRSLREDVLMELEEFHGGPRAADKDNGFYAGELLERIRAGLRFEPKSREAAERQVASMRTQISRLREDITRDEQLLSELEARIDRLSRAFSLTAPSRPIDRARVAAYL